MARRQKRGEGKREIGKKAQEEDTKDSGRILQFQTGLQSKTEKRQEEKGRQRA